MRKKEKKIPTWEELLASLNNCQEHPADAAWDAYRYLNAHLGELSSEETRSLLACVMKIPLPRPSLLHSCLLSVALRMAEAFPDFKLLNFLILWGYDTNLRPEDRQQQVGKDGRTFMSLEDRTERTVRKYLTQHPAECPLQPVKELPMIATPVIGYVHSYDAGNDYYHIYDNLSRHFVAVSPQLKPQIGDFVWFAPIIPRESKFKAAIVIKSEEPRAGQETFGLVEAEVTVVNRKESYLGYRLLTFPQDTTEGEYAKEGYASLRLVTDRDGKPASNALRKGQRVKMLLYLTRGKDALKHNHIEKILASQ